MKEKSNPKKEYLYMKMFDGARALYDFFEEMRSDKQADPIVVAEKLKDKYHLTENQRGYLDGIGDRTSKARIVVQYLERRFGLNEDGTFQDTQGLHKLLFDGETTKIAQARSYNIGIGFTKGVWRDEERGFKTIAKTKSRDHPLYNPIKGTISKLRRGIDANCRTLTFKVPVDSRIGKFARRDREYLDSLQSEKRSIRLFMGAHSNPSKLKKELTEHEFRHVIDEIIGNGTSSFFTKAPRGFFIETPSYLYAGENPSYGLSRDFKNGLQSLENIALTREERLKELQEITAPKTIIDTEKRMISEVRKKLKELKRNEQVQIKAFREFTRRRLSNDLFGREKDNGAKSYLFSTMPRDKLFKRLSELTFPQMEEMEIERG